MTIEYDENIRTKNSQAPSINLPIFLLKYLNVDEEYGKLRNS